MFGIFIVGALFGILVTIVCVAVLVTKTDFFDDFE